MLCLEFTQTYKETTSEKRNGNPQNILQIMQSVRVCTADVTDERKHIRVVKVRRMYFSVLLPAFAHHRAHCGTEPLVWQFSLTDVFGILNNSIDLL